MTAFYFDTSAIVKRYRIEKGTLAVDEIFNNYQSDDKFYTSFLAILEVTSSITRLARNGQISNYIAREILSRFKQDIHNSFQIFPLDDETASSAVFMVEQFGLRSADAIHMATAVLIFSVMPGSSFFMVSSDRELLEAAISCHITPLDPQNDTSIVLIQKSRNLNNSENN
jgi:predicted nucleic acid-binding protein